MTGQLSGGGSFRALVGGDGCGIERGGGTVALVVT
jgi:hypothetical protein